MKKPAQLQNITNNTNGNSSNSNELFNLKFTNLSPTSRNQLVRIHSDSDLNTYHLNNQQINYNTTTTTTNAIQAPGN